VPHIRPKPQPTSKEVCAGAPAGGLSFGAIPGLTCELPVLPTSGYPECLWENTLHICKVIDDIHRVSPLDKKDTVQTRVTLLTAAVAAARGRTARYLSAKAGADLRRTAGPTAGGRCTAQRNRSAVGTSTLIVDWVEPLPPRARRCNSLQYQREWLRKRSPLQFELALTNLA